MKTLLLCMFMLGGLGIINLQAQEIVEPHFSGCEDAGDVGDVLDCADMKLMQFIFSNLKHPEDARAAGVNGKVYASFTVAADGTIKDIEITEGLGHGCDEEVIRLINLMPNWIPGTEDGAAVDMTAEIAVKFVP